MPRQNEKPTGHNVILIPLTAFWCIVVSILLFKAFGGVTLYYLGIVIVSIFAFSIVVDLADRDINKSVFFAKILSVFIGTFWILEHHWLSLTLPYETMAVLVNVVGFLMLVDAVILGIAFMEELE